MYINVWPQLHINCCCYICILFLRDMVTLHMRLCVLLQICDLSPGHWLLEVGMSCCFGLWLLWDMKGLQDSCPNACWLYQCIEKVEKSVFTSSYPHKKAYIHTIHTYIHTWFAVPSESRTTCCLYYNTKLLFCETDVTPAHFIQNMCALHNTKSIGDVIFFYD